MRDGRAARRILLACLSLLPGGCGRNREEPIPAGVERPTTPTSGRPVAFVGFDASQPLVQALKQGKIQALVVQDPFKMGEMGVTTLVGALEKRDIPFRVSTGEVLITSENMDDPAYARLLDPPQVENDTPSGSSAEKKRWRAMVIPKGTGQVFWKTVHAGALKAANDLGNVEVIWRGSEKEDEPSQQIELVRGAVEGGVDGLVLAPLGSRALVQPVEELVDRGIPVVIIDSALESSKIASYVATDNYRGGMLAAQRLGELLKGEGKIILLRYAIGSASTEQRERGFTDTIAHEFPKITFLSDGEYAGVTSELARQKAQALITRYRGQVDGVFCPNEPSTLGMLRALEEAGMLGNSR